MSEVFDSVGAQVKNGALDEKTGLLHTLAKRLAEANVEGQLDIAVSTLDFLEDIEDKTADDIRRLKDQRRAVELIQSEDYRENMEILFCEEYSVLSVDHLRKFVEQVEYEDALEEINLTLIPALVEQQENLLSGIVEKRSIQ